MKDGTPLTLFTPLCLTAVLHQAHTKPALLSRPSTRHAFAQRLAAFSLTAGGRCQLLPLQLNIKAPPKTKFSKRISLDASIDGMPRCRSTRSQFTPAVTVLLRAPAGGKGARESFDADDRRFKELQVFGSQNFLPFAIWLISSVLNVDAGHAVGCVSSIWCRPHSMQR